MTNVVACIDEASSTKKPSGAIAKEAFSEDRLPEEASVFKDPLTAAAKLYVNDAAKAELETLVAEARILGAAFVEPGATAKRPRPTA